MPTSQEEDLIVDLNKLDDHSLQELAKYKELVDAALKRKQDQQKHEVLEKIKVLTEGVNITPSDLYQLLGIQINEPKEKPSRKTKGQKLSPKYRNPNNHEETWTGRGNKPKWLKTLLDQGHELGDFAIPIEKTE